MVKSRLFFLFFCGFINLYASIELKVDKKVVGINEPIYLSIETEAKVLNLEPHIDGVHIIKKDNKNFVLIADKNFSIESMKIEYFEDVDIKIYKSPKIDITVLDSTNGDELLDSDFEYYLNLLIEYYHYILIFMAGFITSRFANITFKQKIKDTNIRDELRATMTKKELTQLLLSKAENPKVIELLEELKSKNNFKNIKNRALKIFK